MKVADNQYSSTSNAAPSSSMYRSSLPSSQSVSSLSIDSSRSPHQAGRRTSSRMSEREPFRVSTTATPRRASQDLTRELSASRASQRMSFHSSPHDSPGGGGLDSPGLYDRSRHQNSPLERRFSRRLNLQRDGITSEPVEEEEIETIQQSRDGAMSLDERIRDAEEKLARRASLRSEAGTPLRRLNSHRTTPSRTTVPSSPITNGNTPYDSADNSTSEGRHGHARVRPSIPELQNGRMVSLQKDRVADDIVHTFSKQWTSPKPSCGSQQLPQLTITISISAGMGPIVASIISNGDISGTSSSVCHGQS